MSKNEVHSSVSVVEAQSATGKASTQRGENAFFHGNFKVASRERRKGEKL